MAEQRHPSDHPVAKLPAWLPHANRFVKWLQRRGIKTGTIHILTVPGRNSGQMRATPISLLSVDGVRYTIGGLENADWVKNVRAAGWGYIAYGKDSRRVRLIELPVEERERILRAFPIEVPHGTQYFERVYGVKPDPDGFATLVDVCPVFQIEDAPETTDE